MTVVVSDSFNRADNASSLGVADTGQTWKYSSGDVFGIMGNAAYCVSGTNPTVAYIDAGISDISLKVKAVQSSVSDYYMAILRYDPANNSGLLLHGNPIKLQTFTNAVFTNLATTAINNAANDIFQIDANGSNIDVYRNGTKLFSVTTTFNQALTNHGIGSWRGRTDGFGGKWDDFSVESLGVTPIGTDGSTAFDLRQSLYSDGSVNGDTKQYLYADGAVSSDVRQTIYSDSFTPFDTVQTIYSDSATGYDTKLVIFQDGLFTFDTLQEIMDGINGSTSFDLKLLLYGDGSALNDTIQGFYQEGTVEFDLLQVISEKLNVWRAETKVTVNSWISSDPPETNWKSPDIQVNTFR